MRLAIAAIGMRSIDLKIERLCLIASAHAGS